MGSIAIVIVNWNNTLGTLKCLSSIYTSRKSDFRCVVVDNGSDENPTREILTRFPAVDIISLTDNTGYTGGNNTGIHWSLEQRVDYVLLLNNDTILDPEMVNQLVLILDNDGSIGAVGPLVYHASRPKVIQSAGGRLDGNWRVGHAGENEEDSGQYDGTREVEWLTGCALMIRTEAIRQVGLLDERFFSYWEEVDWCLRIARAGWRIIHVPQAKLWHAGWQLGDQSQPYVTYYMTRNRLLLLKKHGASPKAWIMILTGLLWTAFSWSVQPKWRSKRKHRDALLQGLVDYLHHRWGRWELGT